MKEDKDAEFIPTTETRAAFNCYDNAEIKLLNNFKKFKKIKVVY